MVQRARSSANQFWANAQVALRTGVRGEPLSRAFAPLFDWAKRMPLPWQVNVRFVRGMDGLEGLGPSSYSTGHWRVYALTPRSFSSLAMAFSLSAFRSAYL